MGRRIRTAAAFSALTLLLAASSLVSPASAGRRAAPAAKPDMPLNTLLQYAVADINKFWGQGFAASGRRYVAPGVYPYSRPVTTACGTAVMNNAFYCPASNSIYFDAGFVRKFYEEVGDYAAVSIIAHEWGHLVQAQLGINRGNSFSIQMELQADCLAGAYTLYAERAGELEEGDMEEAGVGLFNAGDQKGTPWFSPQAHGRPMKRIGSFLDGYKGGSPACFR